MAWTSEKEIDCGHVVGGERRVGRDERVGGRRWRSLERASAVAASEVAKRLLEGVGGGAEVAPPCMVAVVAAAVACVLRGCFF